MKFFNSVKFLNNLLGEETKKCYIDYRNKHSLQAIITLLYLEGLLNDVFENMDAFFHSSKSLWKPLLDDGLFGKVS